MGVSTWRLPTAVPVAARIAGGVIEGTPGRLGGGQAADAVGVAFLGQVERTVGGVQVGMSAAPVGEAGDGHFTEERPGVACLDRRPAHAVGVEHRVQTLLALARRSRWSW
ncbi:MAG: hypothetical protein ACRD0U_07145 [Acidimicrobiales bacterium]